MTEGTRRQAAGGRRQEAGSRGKGKRTQRLSAISHQPSASILICAGIPAGADEGAALELYEKYPPGMVILFAHNIRSEAQVRSLCRDIHALPGRPLITIDLEGGRVNRLKALWGDLPGASVYGSWPLKKIESMAREWGCALKALGVDVDFAPVADLGPAAQGTGLESRTLGETPEEVISRARAFMRGMNRAGVLSCVKHYPGLGASTLDSHRALPRMDLSLRQMLQHLRPFSILKREAPMIMVAHGVYPCLDPSEMPSSLSATIIGLLAKRPAYRGLILSDDLEMGALGKFGSIARRAELALEAGCHMVVVSHEWRALPEVVQRLKRRRFESILIHYDEWRQSLVFRAMHDASR